jgi:hypothetical protein
MNTLQDDNSALRVTRSRAITGILEQTIGSLELTKEQQDSVEETYLECGHHLSNALGLAQNLGDIFPQGSMRLGTVIRPFKGITNVFDLDIVFRVVMLRHLDGAKAFRDSVGRHLKAKYNGIVKPLPKGWRLDHSEHRGYYLDVIPAMDSPRGGNVIAITDETNWKDSNPRDFATIFERAAALEPRFEEVAMLKSGERIANCARIEPLPEHTDFKSPLQRITQISKRYRDYFFNKKTDRSDFATPSIVLTTMLTAAYEGLVHARTYASGFDLLLTCVEDMPSHIEQRRTAQGVVVYWLPNPSLRDENLIAKWKDERHAKAFYDWHADYTDFLRQLLNSRSSPRPVLTDAFGAAAINEAFAKQGESYRSAREQNKLTVESDRGLGLIFGSVAPISSSHIIHGTR